MADQLSQAEIDALMGGSPSAEEDQLNEAVTSLSDISDYVTPAEPETVSPSKAKLDFGALLSGEDKDILGEIGNISMGTAATTLFALLHNKVWITTPVVFVTDWQTISDGYDRPCVGVRVGYKEGLEGSNILILKDRDVKIITDLMMGGTGEVGSNTELSELDMSAIAEAMNQMVGSSSTSLSSMLKHKIDIDTPHAFMLDFAEGGGVDSIGFKPEDIIVRISFKMEIGSLIDSEIMQIMPLDFAKAMVEQLKQEMIGGDSVPEAAPASVPAPPAAVFAPPAAELPAAAAVQPQALPPGTPAPPPSGAAYPYNTVPPPYTPPYPPGYPYPSAPYGPYPQQPPPMAKEGPPVNVQPAQFQPFDAGGAMQQRENMDIIMDVPLEITVELGRTRKKIHEILEFSPGTVVDLDKLAGEPIDVLVNGKFVAKGEVVVIDENFGIRITDILSVDKRI